MQNIIERCVVPYNVAANKVYIKDKFYLFVPLSLYNFETLEYIVLDNLTHDEKYKGLTQKLSDKVINFRGRNATAETYDPSLSAEIETGAIPDNTASFNGNTIALGNRAVAMNNKTVAKGDESLAGGYQSVTLPGADSSIAFGERTTTKGNSAAAFGNETVALGDHTLVFGYHTHAGGPCAFAGGNETTANGENAVALGAKTSAGGAHSFAGGLNTVTMNNLTFAFGEGLRTFSLYQTAFGRYNENIAGNIFEIGNGDDDTHRKTIFSVTRDGRAKTETAPVDDNDLINKRFFDKNVLPLRAALEQSELLTVDEVTGIYNGRLIGDGVNVLDRSIVKVLRVEGNTVFVDNSRKDAWFDGITVSDDTRSNKWVFPSMTLPYGTKLDFMTRQQICTHNFMLFTGDENWQLDYTHSAGFNCFKLKIDNMKIGVMQRGKCSKYYVYIEPYSMTPVQPANSVMFGNYDNYIYFTTPLSTVEEVQADTTGMIIAYPLATELVTAFSPEMIEAGNAYEAIARGLESASQNAVPITVTAEYVVVNKVGG